MQEVKEAIGVESRTTIFNPTYIKEKMKGEAGAANTFAEIVQNTYGWNVMKPKAIDKEMWDEIYNVYVKDKFGLGLHEYFEQQNPAAWEEMTAVMLETVRKGMWKAKQAASGRYSQVAYRFGKQVQTLLVFRLCLRQCQVKAVHCFENRCAGSGGI